MVVGVMRLVRILALLAFVVQTSPLRACAWEQMVLGASCHDTDGAGLSEPGAQPPAAQGCGGHPGEPSQRKCACEIGQQPVHRSNAPVAIDHSPVAVLLDRISTGHSSRITLLIDARSPALAIQSPQISLPLVL